MFHETVAFTSKARPFQKDYSVDAFICSMCFQPPGFTAGPRHHINWPEQNSEGIRRPQNLSFYAESLFTNTHTHTRGSHLRPSAYKRLLLSCEREQRGFEAVFNCDLISLLLSVYDCFLLLNYKCAICAHTGCKVHGPVPFPPLRLLTAVPPPNKHSISRVRRLTPCSECCQCCVSFNQISPHLQLTPDMF